MTLTFSVSDALRRHPVLTDLLALAAGMLTVVAFAPYSIAPLALVGPGLLFLSWLSATSAKRMVLRGYLFGLGLFGFGVSWVYHSLRLFGEAFAPLALPATAVFVGVLALYPAVMGWAASAFRTLPRGLRLVLAWPALWVLFEWLRSTLFTGFPWLLLGDSQVGFTPGWLAPVTGTYGVSWLLAMLGGLLAWAAVQSSLPRRLLTALLIPVLWYAPGLLRTVQWTVPDGKPMRATMIQGNIAQATKFSQSTYDKTLRRYLDMTRAHWDSQLIVWPETALPTLYRYVAKDYLAPLAAEAARHNSTVVVGLFRKKGPHIYDAAVSIGKNAPEFYLKHHLVPFGEYMPLRGLFGWLYARMDVPMSNLSASHGTYVIHAAGIPVGVSICYEIAFGRDVIRALPQAKLLINMSNDAWFGDSLEPNQQLQMARMRALETGRYMLVATNSGISAAVAPDGRILGLGGWDKTIAVTAEVRPMRGATPYVLMGSEPVLWGIGGGLFVSGLLVLRYRRRQRLEES
ncbi:apolipoprotein N-acyltransferase [Acidihalobacter ferrooxydans]|uniref:Apolipoprotein N-acyltransferase n=1 Tax=Acidihalobacter ferrooxydans TaxID=1765967 RepID=A0A1P8UEU5_9GAMM|nr:apolipoprotein N-acyltransferase [Acidihalobacter ferrooxydans]APZ42308.1 apolipoprotein N-acyltransferase [Acidihalobacter ferrooxydans]